MHLLRLFLLLFYLVGSSAFGGAAPMGPVALDAALQGPPLSNTGQLLWWEDANANLTIDAVRDPVNAERFTLAPHPPHPSNSRQPYWFKVVLEQKAPSGDWVLATQTTAIHDVRFYGPFDAQGRELAPPVHTGLSQPFSSRPLGSERYLARMQLPAPGRYTMYVRMVSGTASNLDLSVWDAAEYLQWRQHKRLFDGICYGILLAMLIYNLALAGIFRDSTYGMYIGQCAFALLTLASYNGHAASYLWGDWPWWQERAHVVLPGLWLLFATLFARSFLQTRQVAWVDRMLLLIGALAGISALLGSMGQFRAAQTLDEIVAMAGTIAGLVAALVILRRGFRPARWYLAGQALLFLAVLGVVLVNWNVIDSPFLLANGLQIGVAAEMVVFAIALSSRIGRMQASQIELSLHAAHMAQAAATDPLTGLANRNGLAQGAAQRWADGGAQALMLLDLDRFKPVNDIYGHDAGDAVLCAVAERLQAHASAGDIVARLGGDEFVLLLSGLCTTERLSALARRLGDCIGQPVQFDGAALTVGVSIGIARRPQDGHSLTQLMRCADQAMYQAKQTRTGHAFYSSSG